MEGLSYHVQNPTHVKTRRLRVLLTNYVALLSFESAEKYGKIDKRKIRTK